MNQIDNDEIVRRLRADIDRMVGDAGQSLPPPVPAARLDSTAGGRRWIPIAAAAAMVVVLVGGLVAIANRDDDTPPAATTPATAPATPVPTSAPAVSVPSEPDVTAPPEQTAPGTTAVAEAQMYETIAAVIEDAAGPRLCFEVLESLPPQCGTGLALAGWSWDAIDVEQVNGPTSWVDSIYVRGTYDAAAQEFTVAETRLPSDADRQRILSSPMPDFSLPCAEPEGGWPARNQEWPGEDIAAIDGYAGAWVDESQQVMTVKFTGDLAAAEAAVRQYYSDAVCIVAATRSQAELQAIQQQLMQLSSIQMLGSAVYVDASGEWVEADVIAPDPGRQAAFDAEWGPGVVRLDSELHTV